MKKLIINYTLEFLISGNRHVLLESYTLFFIRLLGFIYILIFRVLHFVVVQI